MYFRAIVFSIFSFAPMMAYASEGLIFAAIYECHAEEINQNMVKACTGSYPEMSTLATDALRAWRVRNAVKAKLSNYACESELQQRAKTGPASEISAVREQMADVKKEINNGFLARIKADGKNACTETLHQLATDMGAMDLK